MSFIRQSLQEGDIVHLWCHSDTSNDGVIVTCEGENVAMLAAHYSDDPLRQNFIAAKSAIYQFNWDEEKIKVSLAYSFSPHKGVDGAIQPLWSTAENEIAPDSSAYHFTPPWGWMNDPNGVCWANGVYHLYYQTMPHVRKRYRAALHWGHATSRDGVSWTHLPIFLSPREAMLMDAEAEGGIYSGSAIVNEDGSLRIFYTDHEEARRPDIEWQMTCLTQDSIAPSETPQVIINTRPDIAGISNDLRDPYVFKGPDGLWKMLLGSRSNEGGIVLLYETPAPDAATGWRYVGQIASFNVYGAIGVAECPCLLPLGESGLWAMPVSLICHDRKTRRRNLSLVRIGHFDGKNFTLLHETELDYGPDFYAFQGNIDADGHVFGIAWAAHWPDVRGTDCIVSATLPRRLEWRGDHLVTPPFHETQKLRQQLIGNLNRTESVVLPEGTAEIEMALTLDHAPLTIIFDIEGHQMKFTIADGAMVLFYDSHATSPLYRAIGIPKNLRIFVDIGLVEIYADDGRWCFTKRIGNMERVNAVQVSDSSRIRQSRIWQLKRVNFGVKNAP